MSQPRFTEQFVETEQAKHRKLMVRVTKELTSEDFDYLIYSLCVPDDVVERLDHKPTHLLRYLEAHKVVSPNNYDFLLWALDTIGRVDIIKKIVMPSTVPYMPQSFGMQEQTFMVMLKAMLRKKQKYIHCMKALDTIIQSDPERKSRFGDLFTRVFPILTAEQNEQGLELVLQEETAAATLIQLSLFWKKWPITLATFQQNGVSDDIKKLMKNCHDYFDCFNKSLPPNWDMETRQEVTLQRNKAQHPFGNFAREAHGALHELSVELIGEHSLKKVNQTVERGLFALESVYYTSRYLMPIYKWLLVLLHSASLSVIDVSKFHEILKEKFSDHWPDICRNKEILVEIVGKEAMDRVGQDLLQDVDKKDSGSEESDFDISTYSSIVSSVSVVWHVSLVVLASIGLKCEVDHNNVQKKLAKFIADQKQPMMQMYLCLSKRTAEEMQKEVDCFRENYAQKVRQVAGGSPEILEIIQSFFSHKEASVVSDCAACLL